MIRIIEEVILPRIVGILRKKETLTRGEQTVQDAFLAGFDFKKCGATKPTIVAIIGLFGSNKGSVAQLLAEHIGATVVRSYRIHAELRKRGEGYEKKRTIAENVALGIAKRGSNVILDSNFVDAKKRASLREKARKAGVRLVFICTYYGPVDIKKPPCAVIADIDTSGKYWKAEVEACARRLLRE